MDKYWRLFILIFLQRCLKKYCNCFRCGAQCTMKCTCVDCLNTSMKKLKVQKKPSKWTGICSKSDPGFNWAIHCYKHTWPHNHVHQCPGRSLGKFPAFIMAFFMVTGIKLNNSASWLVTVETNQLEPVNLSLIQAFNCIDQIWQLEWGQLVGQI